MKQRATEARYDFNGGLNLSATSDTLDIHEVGTSTNCRIEPSGAIRRRAGTSKMHAAPIGAGNKVLGLVSWTPVSISGDLQYVAIAGAKLYYSADLVTWTAVTPSSGNLSQTDLTDFATMTVAGNSLLFIASGSDVFTWSGSTLTKRDLVANMPQGSVLRVYNNRLFMNNNSGGNGDGLLYASALNDGLTFTIGGLSDGLAAALSASVNEPILALETLGSSLLIATRTGIKRLTGTSDDIRIETDTAGITDDIGPVYNLVGSSIKAHPLAFKRIEQAIMMWTDRGPYVVTEAGVTSLGEKLQLQGHGVSIVQWKGSESPAYIGHNTRRSEIWFVYSSITDTGASTALVYNYSMQAWMGPFKYSFAVTSLMNSFVNGIDTLLAGCSDGFVRNLDDATVSKDDGNTDYTHSMSFAPFTLDAGPFNRKCLRSLFVQVQRTHAVSIPLVYVSTDGSDPIPATLVSNVGADNTPANLRYDVEAQGDRFVVTIEGASANSFTGDNWRVLGVLAEGSIMDRW